ncbi:MAG TPA: Na+/H+ antiporter subunit B [Roseiflexaceae bacterium]|jgi:multicomponent Na+:H+ antiporter subunit B|nr:Na+/H+ antiporter subunit B [Roseiflexaceae bacterium]
MNSLILRTATRLLVPLLILFSIFLLLRGHNEPGGGFVGGLVAAAAFALYGLSYDEAAARDALRIDTRVFIAIGLLLACGSALVPIVLGDAFMTGVWGHVRLFDMLDIELGTPMFFDIGVYLAVLGVTLTIMLTMAEE